MRRPVLEEFRERARGLSRKDEIDAATLAILDAFDASAIHCFVLKGPALVQFLYGPDERRGYSDVDLLISPDDLPRAREALAAHGCTGGSEGTGIDDVAGIIHSEVWARWDEKGHPVAIDLHWRLAGCDASPAVAWEALEAHRTWIELAGRRIPVLDRVGLALHLATHAAQHGPHALKSVADLERGVERWSLDVWQSAAHLARKVEGTLAFAAGLRLSPKGHLLADQLGLPPTDELGWRILQDDFRPRGTFHLQAWTQARSIRQRIDVLRRSLFPQRDWIGWEYPWARGKKVLLLAAYGLHLLRAPMWAVRAWWFERRARRAAR
jgi:hypothetical protein